MARAESGVRYPGRSSPVPAVCVRTRSDLCCGARECARASHLAASSRASPLAGPHGHNNGPCAACLPAVIVLSVSWLDAGLATVLPVRCRSTPSGRRESPKGLEAPGQAELKPRPAGALCVGGLQGTGAFALSTIV